MGDGKGALTVVSRSPRQLRCVTGPKHFRSHHRTKGAGPSFRKRAKFIMFFLLVIELMRRTKIETLTSLPQEVINNIVGGERDLLSKAKLVSKGFNQDGVNKIAMCESPPLKNKWCLRTKQGDRYWEYNRSEGCWKCNYPRATVTEVIREIANLNGKPDSFCNDMLHKTQIDDKDPHHVVGNLDLSFNQLTELPESFGSLTVGGYLWLNNNRLTTLPESFGSLKVGGDLWLDANRLTTLPESFGSLNVGGDVYLSRNELAARS